MLHNSTGKEVVKQKVSFWFSGQPMKLESQALGMLIQGQKVFFTFSCSNSWYNSNWPSSSSLLCLTTDANCARADQMQLLLFIFPQNPTLLLASQIRFLGKNPPLTWSTACLSQLCITCEWFLCHANTPGLIQFQQYKTLYRSHQMSQFCVYTLAALRFWHS